MIPSETRARITNMEELIELYKQDIDRSLLAENLQRTVEERFLNLMELQRFAEELRRAGQAARNRG